jgi:hypothetical protein
MLLDCSKFVLNYGPKFLIPRPTWLAAAQLNFLTTLDVLGIKNFSARLSQIDNLSVFFFRLHLFALNTDWEVSWWQHYRVSREVDGKYILPFDMASNKIYINNRIVCEVLLQNAERNS